MAILPSSAFQSPFPACVTLLPPTGPLQWLFRILLLLLTLCCYPLILFLVPISVLLPTKYARLPLHPDNMPPHRSTWSACRRGWWAYIASDFLWSMTSTGAPPDHGIKMSRYLAHRGLRHAEHVARQTGSDGKGGHLSIHEDEIQPLPIGLCVGALQADTIPRQTINAFWLCSSSSNDSVSLQDSVKKANKAILWLAGGGYVTGYPLIDRPIFSLARVLPPGDYTILAPCISKALCKARSFPVPLLDALAAYRHLRLQGFEPEDIVVIGNSAGGGLTWSLISYLVAIDEEGMEDVGVPSSVILISPWLKLPPTTAGEFPDFVNTPQLLNAARCYLARYPISGHRSDPFRSSIVPWMLATKSRLLDRLDRLRTMTSSQPISVTSSRMKEPIPSDSSFLDQSLKKHIEWFDTSAFTQLSSRHPLISPSTDISSPFVKQNLTLLAQRKTRILVHCGTAEWFYEPIVEVLAAATMACVDIRLVENRGGLHSEACLRSPERGGPAKILQDEILDFLGLGQKPSDEKGYEISMIEEGSVV